LSRQYRERERTIFGFPGTYRPANLLEGNSVSMSDGDMFIIISHGIPDRMPAMRANLPTARDRWDVVNYVRYLQGQAGQ
jgi:hypothetical protein